MATNKRLTWTVKETAAILGLSKNSAYQGVLAGEIPHIKVGKRILVPCQALERMLNEAAMKRRGGNG